MISTALHNFPFSFHSWVSLIAFINARCMREAFFVWMRILLCLINNEVFFIMNRSILLHTKYENRRGNFSFDRIASAIILSIYADNSIRFANLFQTKQSIRWNISDAINGQVFGMHYTTTSNNHWIHLLKWIVRVLCAVHSFSPPVRSSLFFHRAKSDCCNLYYFQVVQSIVFDCFTLLSFRSIHIDPNQFDAINLKLILN